MPFLNERCGLSPEEGLDCRRIRSLEAALVLELKSNHLRRVPKEGVDDAIRVNKEVIHLPDDAKPSGTSGAIST